MIEVAGRTFSRVHHVAYIVRDIDESLAFYRDALGMVVTYDNMIYTPRDATGADFPAVLALNAAAEGGDQKAIAAAVGEVGGACKACHDEYKSKNYLY